MASLVPKLPPSANVSGPQADVSVVIARLQTACPKDRLFLMSFPNVHTREFQAIAMRPGANGGSKMMMAAHPVTGEPVGDVNLTSSWLGFVHNLHISLLAGPADFIANGIAAILLLVITATRLFLWWPGIRAWVRAFTVDFSRNWKRINFDLHNTMGFYTLLIVLFQAISTVYSVWEDRFTAAVNKVSRVTLPDRINLW